MYGHMHWNARFRLRQGKEVEIWLASHQRCSEERRKLNWWPRWVKGKRMEAF